MAKAGLPGSNVVQPAPEAPGDGAFSFIERLDGFWATGPRGRCWHISKVLAGWRLDFRDPGDNASTYAGTHASVDRAKREAELVTGTKRRTGALPR